MITYMQRSAKAASRLVLDYPKETERITSPQYTIRLSASEAFQMVEVSIDAGPWQECRRCGGHYWFDWTDYSSGPHEIEIRGWLFSDEIREVAPRRVLVALKESAPLAAIRGEDARP